MGNSIIEAQITFKECEEKEKGVERVYIWCQLPLDVYANVRDQNEEFNELRKMWSEAITFPRKQIIYEYQQ